MLQKTAEAFCPHCLGEKPKIYEMILSIIPVPANLPFEKGVETGFCKT